MFRLGSRSFEGAELQRRLNSVAGESPEVDGEFGSLTDAAVRRFQSARGCEVDGVVRPATWGELTAGMPQVTVAPSGAAPPWPGRFLVIGLVGDEVRTWQQRMAQRRPIAVDGEYGPEFQGVCIEFQRTHSLEVDGSAYRPGTQLGPHHEGRGVWNGR